jgi:cytochrome c oxidase subunit 3
MSAAAKDQPETMSDARARIGMWVFLCSEIMFFGPVFFAYMYGRYEWSQAFEAASRSTDLMSGAINTAVLLSSSLGVAAALLWAEGGARQQARRTLDVVLLLGLIFLLIKGHEYVQDWNEHLVPGPRFHLDSATDQAAAQLFYFIYFFATLLHALHLVIGMGLMLYCRRQLRKDPTHSAVRRIEITGLYWHFVDIIWIFLYPMLYLAGRAL